MKRSSTILLQIVTVLIGICALAFMLLEPHFEGRNVNATIYEIYFRDWFLICAYTASIPFFIAVYQVFKVLGYAGRDMLFSQPAVKAMQTIKYCARTLVGFVVAAEVWLFLFNRGKDDIAGGVFMGLLLIFAFGVVAIASEMVEKILQKAVDTKS